MGSSTAKVASNGKGILEKAGKFSIRPGYDDCLAVGINATADRKSRSVDMCEALGRLEDLQMRTEAFHARNCGSPTEERPEVQFRQMSLADVLSEGPDIIRAKIDCIESTLESIEARLF